MSSKSNRRKHWLIFFYFAAAGAVATWLWDQFPSAQSSAEFWVLMGALCTPLPALIWWSLRKPPPAPQFPQELGARFEHRRPMDEAYSRIRRRQKLAFGMTIAVGVLMSGYLAIYPHFDFLMGWGERPSPKLAGWFAGIALCSLLMVGTVVWYLKRSLGKLADLMRSQRKELAWGEWGIRLPCFALTVNTQRLMVDRRVPYLHLAWEDIESVELYRKPAGKNAPPQLSFIPSEKMRGWASSSAGSWVVPRIGLPLSHLEGFEAEFIEAVRFYKSDAYKLTG